MTATYTETVGDATTRSTTIAASNVTAAIETTGVTTDP
jgi:hypothetical protein